MEAKVMTKILDILTKINDGESVIKNLYPDISVTLCGENDLIDDPYAELKNCKVFLVDRSDHCWKITDQLNSAGGIVVAKKR